MKSIGFSLNKCSRQLRRLYNATLQENGINSMQARLLGFLIHHPGPIYQKDLQEHFDSRRSTISGVIDTMVKNGLIVRSQDQGDKRLNRLDLTEKGQDLSSRSCALLDKLDDKIFSCMSEEEKSTFSSFIERIQKSIEENAHA